MPNFIKDWDAGPRVNQNDTLVDIIFPYMATRRSNTPEVFKAALKDKNSIIITKSTLW